MRAEFDGKTYDPQSDWTRLSTQLHRVLFLMMDGQWRTISEVQRYAGGTESACSARLRDLRKPKFGGYKIERRSAGDRQRGLFEYRIASGA